MKNKKEIEEVVTEEVVTEEVVTEEKKVLKFNRNVFYDKREFKVGDEWVGEIPAEIKEYLA